MKERRSMFPSLVEIERETSSSPHKISRVIFAPSPMFRQVIFS
jgi:hypothetical protein